jgi:hypothetical protein
MRLAAKCCFERICDAEHRRFAEVVRDDLAANRKSADATDWK